MSSVVQHLPAQNRYVFATNGVEVGLTDYRLVDHDIHITHTEIEPSMRHTGLASEMVQAVLDHIRADTDYRVVADCPYVVTWLSRHPEYQALEQRA
jgi:predicted GNAT family acetyltransferase